MPEEKLKQIKLEEVPTAAYKYVLKMQGEIKIEKNTSQYSLEKTIYRIIKEHEEMSRKLPQSVR